MVQSEQRERRSREPVIGEDGAIRQAVSAASVGLWQLDGTLRRLACDGVSANILGLQPESRGLTVEALTGLIPAEERPDFLCHLQAAIRTGQYDHSHRIEQADGSMRWVRSVGSRVVDGAGQGLLAGILMDITFLKEAEAAVAAREESLRLLEQATDIGIYETDAGLRTCEVRLRPDLPGALKPYRQRHQVYTVWRRDHRDGATEKWRVPDISLRHGSWNSRRPA